MLRGGGVLALVVASVIAPIAFVPAPALGASGNAAATHAYINADYKLVAHAAARLGTGEAALQKVLATTRNECPLAAGGSPQDPESTQLSNELIGDLVTSAYQTDVPSIREFLRTVGGLRWSNHAVSSAISTYVAHLRVLVGLAPPNICADVRAWAASSFHALPATTLQFSPKFMGVWVALGEQPPALNRYESGGDRGVARSAAQREQKIGEFEAHAVETWGNAMTALDLWP